MLTAAELAGFFAAHAIWCVSDGETLIPIIAFQQHGGERQFERLVVDDDLEASVAAGQGYLQSNEMNADDAVLLFDGRIHLEDGATDAIIVEVRAYFSPDSAVQLAIPYTPATAGRFLVHKPKVLEWTNCDDFDHIAFMEAFFKGVASHEHAAPVWNTALDESK